MPARTGTAHVVTTTRKYKGQVYRTHLLRRSYREGGTVKNETLGNLSHLPESLIEIIRRSLQGETFVPVAQAFEITRSRPHGHVQAVATAMQRLGLASLIASTPCRERDLALAMITSRIVAPHTKLATTRWWHTTTLADDFGVADADEDDLYAAMDWLLARQDRIQKKLASRHLCEGGLVLYDLSSSYFEGTTCELAKLGLASDSKKGLLQVNYGLLTDARGCPVAVSVHEGNTADSRTFMPAVHKLREDFGIERMVMVGDRGMVSQKAIDEMREADGIGWITALKSASIRALLEQGHLQMDLFDERKRARMRCWLEYPGERLVACRNEALARLRAHKREELLAATERHLEKIKARVDAGKLSGQDAIGVRVGKIINQYKVAKHFDLSIADAALSWARKQDSLAREAALDGLYIVRTSVPATQMDAPSACATTSRWQTSSAPSARSRPSTWVHLITTARPIGCARTSSCACSPTSSIFAQSGRVDVRRNRGASQGHARPRGASQAIRVGTGQGRHPLPQRRHASTQLRHLDGRARQPRAQYLPHTKRRARRAHFRAHYYSRAHTRARSRARPGDPPVDRKVMALRFQAKRLNRCFVYCVVT